MDAGISPLNLLFHSNKTRNSLRLLICGDIVPLKLLLSKLRHGQRNRCFLVFDAFDFDAVFFSEHEHYSLVYVAKTYVFRFLYKVIFRQCLLQSF